MSRPSERVVDVAVVGGGPAGLSAALVLARSRRSVVVIDAGEPRNAPAAAMHAFLSRDGMAPDELLTAGRAEVVSYGGEVEPGRVVRVERRDDRFRLVREEGSDVHARRLVLTMGVRDLLPEVAGLADRWGRDVVHCPYCHGWEVRDRAIGVLNTSPMSAHQVGLFRQLSERVVLLQHDGPAPDPEASAGYAARGVEVVEGRVTAMEVVEDALSAVVLEDGRRVEIEVLVVAPRLAVRSPLLEQLGLEVAELPHGVGQHVVSDPMGATDVPGVWVAGNLTDPSAQVIAAAAQGNRVGAAVNADLVAEEIARARGAA